ncbi:hypothetical protein [Microbispora sp. H10885]|uniref:hypothetical protein n=1 Tax=Microbispora sp. H10885 TaxID=2729110 RepID=UPI001600A409|nr:hypothetical protein [Microbispora sp. H10885]
MKIYVTSRSQATLDVWARLLPQSLGVELVNEAGRAVQADVIVVSGKWAFDRYGGVPNRQTAQIRPNIRNDRLPEWVVIPPFRPVVERDGQFEIRSDFKDMSPAHFGILESLKVILQNLGDSCSVILDLPLLGMDDPYDESTPVSVASAINKILPENEA